MFLPTHELVKQRYLVCTRSCTLTKVARFGLLRLIAAAVALTLGALIVAACGGSGSRSTATSASTDNGSSSGATQPATIEGDQLNQMPSAPEPTASPPALSGRNASDVRTYLRAVFDDAQSKWDREFTSASQQWTPARLTIFSHSVESSGCGVQAGVGPFYCSANHRIYLDLGFMKALTQRFGIGGFAQAYVVGHEFGHHIQNLTGILQRLAVADHQDPAGKNERSVRFELQADCLAGVWAHSVYQRAKITRDDITAALHAAQFIGDDFQQHISGNAVDSGLWTHGSSAQRQRWFTTGFDKGDPGACDTFSAATV